MWEGLGFVCPGAGRGPLGLYLLQSQNRLEVPLALTALEPATWSKTSPPHLLPPLPTITISTSNYPISLFLAEKLNLILSYKPFFPQGQRAWDLSFLSTRLGLCSPLKMRQETWTWATTAVQNISKDSTFYKKSENKNIFFCWYFHEHWTFIKSVLEVSFSLSTTGSGDKQCSTLTCLLCRCGQMRCSNTSWWTETFQRIARHSFL